MKCEEVVQKYEDYLLGHFSAQERESIAGHIRNCVDCFRLDESNREFCAEGKFKKFIRINLEASR